MKKILATVFIMLLTLSAADAVIVTINAPAGQVFVGPNKSGKAREYNQDEVTGTVEVKCDETVSGNCVINNGSHLQIDYEAGSGGTSQLYIPQDI